MGIKLDENNISGSKIMIIKKSQKNEGKTENKVKKNDKGNNIDNIIFKI